MSQPEPINFRPKPLHALAAVVLLTTCSTFLAFGMAMTPKWWIGALLAFLVCWDIYFIVLLMVRPAILRLDRDGVTYGLLWRRRTMPWSSIGRIVVSGEGDSTIVILIARTAGRPFAELGDIDPELSLAISNKIVRIAIDEALVEIIARVPQGVELIHAEVERRSS